MPKLDLQPPQPMRETDRIGPIERRYCFAAWPQTVTHASWFEALDDATGMTVSRNVGRTVGALEHAVAQSLLMQVGVSFSQRVADNPVPLWAMQVHGCVRDHLSTVAALSVLPPLRLAIGGAQARQWDAVLGSGVRHAVLVLAHANPQAEPPVHAIELRRQAIAAAQTQVAWETFCFRLGLAALSEYNAAVQARFRLIWPCAMRDEEPLGLEDPVHAWLVRACMLPTRVQRGDLACQGRAA